MKYFLSGMLWAVFVISGIIGLAYNKVEARVDEIPQQAQPCTWSEIKLCYAGVANGCCPGDKGDG